MPKMYPNTIKDMKSGLLPITTLVRKDLAMEILPVKAFLEQLCAGKMF